MDSSNSSNNNNSSNSSSCINNNSDNNSSDNNSSCNNNIKIKIITPDKTIQDNIHVIKDLNRAIYKHIDSEWDIDYRPLGKGGLSIGIYNAVKKDGSISCCTDKKHYNIQLNNKRCTIKIITKVGKYEFQTLDKLININENQHEHIIRFYGYGLGKCPSSLVLDSNDSKSEGVDLVDGKECLFIYMEYLEGYKSISDILNERVLGEFEFKEIAIKLVNTMVYLHKMNIIHRDIKCSNILLNSSTGDIKLIDFGISRVFENSSKYDSIVGTKSHMAPEIYFNNDNNPETKPSSKSDVWSFGCTLIEMAGGDLKKDDKTGIPNIPNSLPSEVKSLIRHCLVVDVLNRPYAIKLLDHPAIKSKSNQINNHLEVNYDQLNAPDDSSKLIIPDNIQSLTIIGLKVFENSVIEFNNIPSHVNSLILPSFNSNFNLLSKIPSTITSLSLPIFNQIIESGSIPNTITSLKIPMFNHELQEESINSSITHLEFGKVFNINEYGGNLPNTITSLKCDSEFGSTLYINNNIPRGLSTLQLINYNQPIAPKTLPQELKTLTLGSKYTHFQSLSNLPSSLIDLTINVGNECKLSDQEITKDISNAQQMNIIINRN